MGLGSKLKRAATNGVHSLFLVPPLEAALTRFTRDRDIVDAIARLAPVNLDYKHPSYRTVTRNGINFKLDISDYQDWIVYWGIRTDRPTDLYSLVRPNQVVFDVGTNIGEVCLNLASLVGSGGRVYAFEPDPVSYQKLADNLALNGFHNIVASNIGLGETPTTLTMKVNSPNNRGGNRIMSSGDSPEHFAIQVETIDGFIAKNGIEQVDVMKVDVEGFELAVLKGAAECLRTHRPQLFVEVGESNLREQGSSARELVDYIRSAGYHVYQAKTGRELTATTPIDSYFDAICTPRRA